MHKTNAFLPSREELFQGLLIPVGFHVIIIEVYENARGETKIVTLSGDVESHFVIKEKTKISAPAEVPFNIGGYIMLNTTGTSDGNVKECKVVPGRMNEGRLVYVEGNATPFLLSISDDGGRLLVKLIDEEQKLVRIILVTLFYHIE